MNVLLRPLYGLPLITLTIAIFRRHVTAALAAVLLLLLSASALPFTRYIVFGLRAYLTVVTYIHFRARWKAQKWTALPAWKADAVGGSERARVVRCVDGEPRVRCPEGLNVEFAASTARVASLARRWLELSDSASIVYTTTGYDGSYFWHVEFTTTFWGFCDDVGIRVRQRPRKQQEDGAEDDAAASSIVEWHSRSRWASDFGSNATRLAALIEYVRDNL
ncbi:hypothetical protein BDZ88DRAFT_417696 [Geranomyces variabilis]|nr:hypothetical protein BDZ88DRAFT_417696 [Geranomyces variabilis]KAJ3138348.1 hypothetical protein HDU90_001310 [Geranomyces variabilis]